MNCPACNARVVAFAVPTELREHLPGEATHAALCTQCLRLHRAEEETGTFADVDESFPTGEAGVAMAIAIGLLDSLALHRRSIAVLFERVETDGVDPFLVLDRIAAAETTDSAVDLDSRRRQVEQLL